MSLETEMDGLRSVLGELIYVCSKTTATVQVGGAYDNLIYVPIDKKSTVEFV